MGGRGGHEASQPEGEEEPGDNESLRLLRRGFGERTPVLMLRNSSERFLSGPRRSGVEEEEGKPGGGMDHRGGLFLAREEFPEAGSVVPQPLRYFGRTRVLESRVDECRQ